MFDLSLPIINKEKQPSIIRTIFYWFKCNVGFHQMKITLTKIILHFASRTSRVTHLQANGFRKGESNATTLDRSC